MIKVTPRPDGCVISVNAQPGARKNALLGEHAGALRVAVTAAPERGKANEAIAEVLAEALGCRASKVFLVSGETSRVKKFLVREMTPDELRTRIVLAST